MKNNMPKESALFRVAARSVTASIDAAERFPLSALDLFRGFFLTFLLSHTPASSFTPPGATAFGHGETRHHAHIEERPYTARRRDLMVLGLT